MVEIKDRQRVHSLMQSEEQLLQKLNNTVAMAKCRYRSQSL